MTHAKNLEKCKDTKQKNGIALTQKPMPWECLPETSLIAKILVRVVASDGALLHSSRHSLFHS